ncbi:MAG: hypothetical protein R3F07_11935 [Opitutaceae bacterium]
MHKLTRISFNPTGWRSPTGEARKYEARGTFNNRVGYGHEDWLFRSEWVIDGWRYSFIQGVNKSHTNLVRAGESFDLTLFTIQPDRMRRFVATISDIECLDKSQAADALAEFKKRGWYQTMCNEVEEIGGDISGLTNAPGPEHILNIRYQQRNISEFPKGTFAKEGDRVLKLQRYQLFGFRETKARNDIPTLAGRFGSLDLPDARTTTREAVPAIDVTPEHARMQAQLMKELQAEFPNSAVIREEDFVDVSVRKDQELLLFEIKTALQPRKVIREALGQILEYAYYPGHEYQGPVKLVIVGRNELKLRDREYLRKLQNEFRIPLDYRVVGLTSRPD